MSAFYFYAYAAMQLPMACWWIVWPARLIFIGALMAGHRLFAVRVVTDVGAGSVGRALVGASHAVAWVSMLQLITHWFPSRRFGAMSEFRSRSARRAGWRGHRCVGWPNDFGWRAVIAVSQVQAQLLSL